MLPLSLYIHIPWCIRKCPYCDFNSHKTPDILPEDAYINALIADLKTDLLTFPKKNIESIFIGGGTPSLFLASSFDKLLSEINKLLNFADNIEITLEANPGTVEQKRFSDYRSLGINRLSLGIQSFNANKLKALGRIHDDNEAHNAIKTARKVGFDNINIDLMHSLPNQTIHEAIDDLQMGLNHEPEHLSWYQLTLEPNTVFYKKQPTLPSDDETVSIEEEGFNLLQNHNLNRYEISAFAKEGRQSRHNLNYWLFGDYFGIGAGAHGKLTSSSLEQIYRTRKHKQPKDYLNQDKSFISGNDKISSDELIFEFMLNTTRLQQAINNNLFFERTGLKFDNLLPKLHIAKTKGLITINDSCWQVTNLGRQFTNDLQEIFLPDNESLSTK